MKRFVIGMAMSAALVIGSMTAGCGGECDKECDKFIKCMKDMGGGKMKAKKLKKQKKECVKECKKDTKKAKTLIKEICGK